MIFPVLKNYTENRISVIHFWNRFGSVFIKPIPNRLSGFRTSLVIASAVGSWGRGIVKSWRYK